MPEKPHRSRTAWPGPMSVAGVEPGHDHELPKPLVQRVRRLTLAVVIVGGCLAAIVALLLLLILLRGDYRDRENERTNDRINDAICDLLDQLPEGGLLERPRHKYGCGSGIPLGLLSPEEQAQVAGRRPPTTTPVPPTTVTPAGPPSRLGGATSPPPPTPTPVPTRPPQAPRPLPTPTPSPLDPITGTVCDALGVCLQRSTP